MRRTFDATVGLDPSQPIANTENILDRRDLRRLLFSHCLHPGVDEKNRGILSTDKGINVVETGLSAEADPPMAENLSLQPL